MQVSGRRGLRGVTVLALVAAGACGRYGFDAVPGDGISNTGTDGDGGTDVAASNNGSSDATAADAPTIAVCATTPAFTAIASGWDTTCAIDTTARLWCWGSNTSGQLGQGDTAQRFLPSQVPGSWAQVSVGGAHVCGRQTDNSLWCWGNNGNGQLGLGDLTPRSVPTRVGTLSDWSWITAAWGDVGNHTCGVRGASTLWCWGQNNYNQLGFNGADKKTPTQVGTATIWVKAACGADSGAAHSCATRSDGTLWCWGSNFDGRLGVGDTIDRTTPTQAGTATDWATPEAGWTQTYALKTDQSLWYAGWGVNAETALPPGGTWLDIQGGWQDAVGIRTDGTLWRWTSSSSYGMSVPGTTWSHVTDGWEFVCGLQTDGTVWCWGRNDVAQLGVGDVGTHTSPTRVCTP